MRWSVAILALFVSASLLLGRADPFTPACDPSDARAVGCVVSLEGSAHIDRTASGSPEVIKAFNRSSSRKAGVHIRSGDSFWLSPGSKAKIYFYYRHGADALNPAVLSGPDDEKERVWFLDSSAARYTDDEMARLRRRLRLAAAPKAIQARDVILPASGDLVSGKGFIVVVRTNGQRVKSCTLSVSDSDGPAIAGEWKALPSWQQSLDVTSPFTLELSSAALARIGRASDARLIVGLEDGTVLNRPFRLSSRSMGEDFGASLRPLIKPGSSDQGSWGAYCDLFENAVGDASVSAVATAIIWEARKNNGIMKGRLAGQNPALLTAIEDLFLQAGFKEDEIWPLLAEPGSK